MSEKKLVSTLDGTYWNSASRSDRHAQADVRQSPHNRSFLYENNAGRDQRMHHDQRQQMQEEQPRYDTSNAMHQILQNQRDIMAQLQYLTNLVQQTQQNCVTSDAFQRFLQHFEESQSELRCMLACPMKDEPMFTPEEPPSVALASCFTEPSRSDVAQTLVSLGDRTNQLPKLHEFETFDTYYWIAFNKAGRQALLISDSCSQDIEYAYQRLLKYGPAGHLVPHEVQVGEVVVNFDSREGRCGNVPAVFNRIKK